MTSVYNILMSLTLIYLKNNYILTLNQQVPGSSPGWVTTRKSASQLVLRRFFIFLTFIVRRFLTSYFDIMTNLLGNIKCVTL